MHSTSSRVTAVLTIAVLVAACSGGGASPSAGGGSQPATASAPASAPAASGGGSSPATADVCTAPAKAAAGTTLTFASYGGVYQKAQRDGWLTPYSALTGVKFTESEDSANATIKAQVESGQVTWDVVDVGNDFGLDANKDVLEPLDYSLIHQSEILDGFSGTYRVADITYGVVLAYRTDKTNGQVPQGWADFFDLQKFPGKRAVSGFEGDGILEIALVADGVDPSQLYPLDVDRALKKLDSIKSEIVYWDSGATSQELLGSGEVALAQIWNGRAANTKLVDGKPVEIQWNQAEVWGGYIAVPKGAAHKDEAMKVIACVISKPYQEALTKEIAYAPSNKDAVPDKTYEAYLPTSEHLGAKFITLNDQYWADNFDAIDAKWQDWKTK